MWFILIALLSTTINNVVCSQHSYNFLQIDSASNTLFSHDQGRVLSEEVLGCTDMCGKCNYNTGICSACKGGYQLLNNACVIETKLNGLLVLRYSRAHLIDVDYKSENVAIMVVGILFAISILGGSALFMLKKESIFSAQKQPADCMPNISQVSQQQPPQQAKVKDEEKEQDKVIADKSAKPDENDKSFDAKEQKDAEAKSGTKEKIKVSSRESREDIEENSHEYGHENSDENKSSRKEINVVIKIESPTADKKDKKRIISGKKDISLSVKEKEAQTVDQEDNQTEKNKKDDKEDEQGSRLESQEQEESKIESSVEKQKDLSKFESPIARRERGERNEVDLVEEPQTLETKNVQNDEEIYLEDSNSDREKSGNMEPENQVTKDKHESKKEEPTRGNQKKEDRSEKQRTQNSSKAPRSEVVFEESFNQTDLEAGRKTIEQIDGTIDRMVTLNEFLDKSIERRPETEDANASAYGFLSAVTKRN